MATVRYGSGITELRGRLGGHVYQPCGKVLAVRQPGARNAPLSQAFIDAKDRLRLISSNWASLSQSVKDQWQDVAHTYPAVDVFGNPVTPSGYNVFVQLHTIRLLCDGWGSIIPTVYNPPAANVISLVGNPSGTFGIVGTLNNNVDAYHRLIVYLDPVIKANSTAKGSHYKYIGSVNVSVPKTFDLQSLLETYFGSEDALYNTYYRFRFVLYNSYTQQHRRINDAYVIYYS